MSECHQVNGFHTIANVFHHLIGRMPIKKRLSNTGDEKWLCNFKENEMMPQIASCVQEVLDHVTVGQIAELGEDTASKAMIAFLRLIKNPYAITAEADATWIKLAIMNNQALTFEDD